ALPADRRPYTAKRFLRRGAGVVDRGGLENRCALAGTVGSNPTLSAISLISMANQVAARAWRLTIHFLDIPEPPAAPRGWSLRLWIGLRSGPGLALWIERAVRMFPVRL